MGRQDMTLFDFRSTGGIAPDSETGDGHLELDDVLSFGGDDLGLDVDSSGHLVLTEGVDFE
jgi:hypothetical protein